MTEALAPWLEEAYLGAMRARAAGRLPHALLVCGPAQLGKRKLADTLAQRLLCASPESDRGCGRCRRCVLFAAGTHPDFHAVGFALNDKGEPRSEIIVDQMRALGGRLQLTPQLGGAQVALVYPADALNHSAANALLKTLEEPPQGRYLILVCDRPQRLPATIRSRCQRLEVMLPAPAVARAWLRQQGCADDLVDAALACNGGHPGLALRDLKHDGLARRQQVTADLVAILAGRDSTAARAREWIGDELEQRLQYAAEEVFDLSVNMAKGTAAASRLVRAGLAARLDPGHLATWFEAANRTRDLLRTTLRQDLLLAELLQQWKRIGANR